ncbi:MAG TPA: hypothetical protein V6C97_28945 [Oculatellaceae cyanobacterium]
MTDKTKDGDFAEWLARRMSASHLTDDEKKVFADWLMHRVSETGEISEHDLKRLKQNLFD